MTDDEKVQFKLMIPGSLKVRLELVAQQQRRSLSAEIIDRLERSFQEPISPIPSSLDQAALIAMRELIAAPVLHPDRREMLDKMYGEMKRTEIGNVRRYMGTVADVISEAKKFSEAPVDLRGSALPLDPDSNNDD